MLTLATVNAIFLAIFSLVQNTAAQDPCLPTTYDLLDDAWRSTAHVGVTPFRCDATLTTKWYRPVSGAGVTMPTEAPDFNKCGTRYPIWMDDVLPDNSDIKSVKVCLKSVFTSCHQTWNIQVKNCSSFYVYELTQTSSCASAYCFGSELPCPVGQTSTNGFTPGCGEVGPDVTLNAVVTPGLKTTTGEISGTPSIIRGIEFQCNIDDNSDVDLTAYVYDVEWFINDNSIVTHRNIPYVNITESALRQSHWIDTFTLGFLVKCAVRVRDKTDGPAGPYSFSEQFYAGFKTNASWVTVKEGGSINVTVRLTIPIDCNYPVNFTRERLAKFEQNSCSLRIRVRTRKDDDNIGQPECTAGGVTDEPVSFDNVNCGLLFSFNDWNTSRTLQVFGASDNTVNNLHSRTIYIKFLADKGMSNPAWASATTPDIKIVVEDQDVLLIDKLCQVYTDPNIKTLDGWIWSFQQIGEFVLFKHETLPIRVHAMLDTCPGGSGSCICGIAIRNQDDVFVINLCRQDLGGPWISSANTNNYAEKKKACDDTNMIVTSKDYEHWVLLPSGTYMYIGIDKVHSSHIHTFTLRPSLVDWKSSSGLCGVLDGTRFNDLRKRDGKDTTNVIELAKDWRHNSDLDGISLFNLSGQLTPIQQPPLQYCRCSGDSDNWQVFSSKVLCNITSTITTCPRQTNSYTQSCDKARAKRETNGDTYRHRRSTGEKEFEIAKYDVTLDEKYADVVENNTWRNGWTEALANQTCREMMNDDPLLDKCKEILPVTNHAIDERIKSCINDIKVSGGTSFLNDMLEVLKSSCLMEASRFENLTKQGSENENGTTFLDELLDLSCPNNCSNKGHCTLGNCVCYIGFFGDNCALEADTIPDIIPGGMTCSSEKKSCKNFVISGRKFLDNNLTCQARLFKVYSDRWELFGAPVIFPAIYLNGINCVCTIPDSTRKRRAAENVFGEGYLISVSNDGINFSKETTIVLYNSACYDCDAANISCTQLESCVTTTSGTTSKATSSYSVSVTIQPSPTEIPSGTANIPLTITTSESSHKNNINTGAGLLLVAIAVCAALVIASILAIAVSVFYHKKSQTERHTINLSYRNITECQDIIEIQDMNECEDMTERHDMTECPPRSNEFTETKDTTSRPATVRGNYVHDDSFVLKNNWVTQ